LTWAEVLAFVSRRRGLLDGVVFSGGEATRQPLEGAIQDLRNLGMAVGLHTSGAYPMRLARLLPLVDWVGFDVKALPQHLAEVTGRPAAARAMTAALRLLLESGVDYQVRTTWGAGVPHLSTPAEAAAVLEWARAQGVENPVLQQVRVDGTSPEFTASHLAAKQGVTA
jgi:pyruvate formate lyase activating enzyme